MRRLIVNADDFGRSASINEAVVLAHRDGILTTASLMVNEPHAASAIAMARGNPRLGVGLHLTLVRGKAALDTRTIPHLVNGQSEFSTNAAVAGMRYFFSRACRAELRLEIAAQFEKFQATGFALDHVNGHLHLHLHPVVLQILLENASQWKIRSMRLTADPYFLNKRLASGRRFYRVSHAVIFGLLARRAASRLRQHGIQATSAVFGLLQNGRVDRAYVEKLLPLLPEGDSELYSHPSLGQFKNEFDALVYPGIRAQVRELDIRLIRYQDL